MKSTKDTLRDYCNAGYAGIYLTSYEERRVEAELAAIAKEIGYRNLLLVDLRFSDRPGWFREAHRLDG